MVTGDGFVKILDFGLAKLTAREPLEGSQLTTAAVGTKDGIIMGTVGYMSPEQARALPVDYRSDQFSLGLILYEMASGTPAFRRETAAQTMMAILDSEPAPLGERSPQVPPGPEGVVSRLLSKDREDRYDSMKDLAKDLSRIRDGLIAARFRL